MIVIIGNEKSIFYYNHSKISWEKHNIKVNVFNAITPDKLKREHELTFSRYSSSIKYTSRNIKAQITETEKACWYSHFKLWQECCYSNKPLLILEHDCTLLDDRKLWSDNSYGIIFFDKAAMGSYIIYPWFAKILVKEAMSSVIDTGPYAFIEFISIKNNFQDKNVNCRHKLFNPAANQVYSNDHGNTIDHYSTINPELFSSQHSHDFIII